jgi:dTDP-4-dehydrorhamnose reductase
MHGLLIGASGQLGRALHSVFSQGYQIVGTAHRQAQSGHLALNLADLEQTQRVLRKTNPDLILIAGAMCSVDGCELEPELCYRINTLGPRTVAEYARTHGARVVFYSTDHVFDGVSELYHECDMVRPLNVYARSKADAEAALRELLPDRHLILRTSWLYGPDAQRLNFPLRCIDCAITGRQILVPEDQWGSPTYTEDLARATRFLVEHGYTGTFHATGPEFIDRVSLARRICMWFRLDDRCIVAMPTSELNQAARRPLQVRLDCRKLFTVGVAAFRGINEGLEALGALAAAVSNR